MLILAAVVPVVGRLADMLGRKNLYNLGFVIFTVGSLLCALAQPQYHGLDLVVYRMIQGVGGALLITNSAAIVTDAFRRGNVGFGLGVNGIAFSAGFLLGPVVGGVAHVDFVATGVSHKRPNWYCRHDMGDTSAQRASDTS